MATLRTRRRKPSGLLFYTTALVVSLFATYSFGKHVLSRGTRPQAGLQIRSPQATETECRLVNGAEDKCAFILANCPDEEAGLVSYLQLYYCSLPHVKPVAFSILVIWLSLLFSTIGIAASDFLCINLSTIAALLGMSESLAGVTFLAFGNGSPDVFSTFAAMSSNSGSLAVGELMGAAGFITAVVSGSMAIIRPFQVARKSFVRDVSFFAIAASFSMVFLADGRLLLWECVLMVAFYVFYVVFVVTWHWWLQKRRRKRLAENVARLHHHIPDEQELLMPEFEDDEEARPVSERASLNRQSSEATVHTALALGTPAWKIEDVDEDEDARNRYLAELSNNMRINRAGRERRNTVTHIRPSLIGALEFRSVLSSLEKKSVSRPIGLRKYSDEMLGAGSRHNLFAASHPELVTDLENQTHTNTKQQVVLGRSRAVSANDAASLGMNTDLLPPQSGTPQSAMHGSIYSASTEENVNLSLPSKPVQLLPPASSPASDVSSSRSPHVGSNGLLAPPATIFNRPIYSGSGQERSHADDIVSPGGLSPNMLSPAVIVSSPAAISPVSSDHPSLPHSKPPSLHLPPPSLSPESTREIMLSDEDDSGSDAELLAAIRWWPYQYLPTPKAIISTLFPTLYGWRKKTIAERMLGIVTAPSVLLLTLTLPVVDPRQQEEQDESMLETATRPVDSATGAVRLPPDTPSMPPQDSSQHPYDNSGQTRSPSEAMAARALSPGPIDMRPGARDWNRWLVILQCFTAPLFIVVIFWANLEEDSGVRVLVRFILGSLIFSLVCLLILLVTTTADQEPRYRPLFCFLGFTVAIAWISTIAGEVVGVLKAIGVILDISDAMLGLTIFAVGNSLGDLVADVTVARLGYPVMALSACFGGPMLNILLGIGIGGMYMTIHKATHKHDKHPDRPMHYKPYPLEVSTTLLISGATLLVTLLGLLVVVPLNGWRMDRRIGAGLIALWTLSTIANVALELAGVGAESMA